MARKVFDPEGLVWKPLGYVGEIVMLSLLWGLCSVPLVTVGPATAALYDCSVHSIRRSEGEPFTRVLLAIKAEADHTGCIYLAVFNDTGRQPLAVYGGPKEAGFTWRMLDDGSLELSELITSDSTAQSRGADAGGSYAEGMTDVANTSVNYSDGNMTVTNGSDSRKLAKADDAKRAEIVKLLFTLTPATNLSSEDSIKINVNPVDSGFWGR